MTQDLTAAAAAYLDAHRAEHLAQLREFLRFASISALSEHHADVARCADWLAGHMRSIGLQNVAVHATARHPIVYGEWKASAAGRRTSGKRLTVLIYGHYDVQPVDPLHLWETPPFEPSLRDGKLYARGASDDKGQTFMHLKAIEAWLKTAGEVPVDVKLLIEGEEEIGSPSLAPFIDAHRELLKADVVVVSDTPLFARGVPSLCYGLRGLAALEFEVRTAKGDLHSGLFGGAVPNALHVLAELVAGLHDRDGRITVPGFYDAVRPLSVEEREGFARLPLDERAYRADLGLPGLFGEKGYSTIERAWARPTLEINGMWGGFEGEGSKTVIPCRAQAKITCRLVPDQDPARIVELVEAHLKTACPPYASLTVRRSPGSARPILTPLDHPAVRAAGRAMQSGYGKEPSFIRMGGSIPVVETFSTLLGLPSVLMGFGLPDENFHAPNEHFHLENFDLGLRTLAHFLRELAAGPAGGPTRGPTGGSTRGPTGGSTRGPTGGSTRGPTG